MRAALERMGPNFIAFTSGACVMVLELVAGRILAPYIGVSLFTWTSIIGIVMAGISLGNFAGGKIADRYPSTATLGVVFFASGLASLGILPATAFMGGFSFPFELHVVDKIVAHVAAIFFLPAFVLGMITPNVVKLALKDIKRTGGTVGAIYASNCMGSILGTFATGFLLISWLGTRPVVWLVALTLILLGVAFGEPWKSRTRVVTTLVVVLLFAGALNWREEWRAPARIESNYYSIAINNRSVENQAVKSLTLDYLVHSYIQVGNPLFLGYAYNKMFAEVTQYLRQDNEALRALFVGGGGYSFPRYMEAVYPHAEIDVIEIDPAITEVVHTEFGMPRTTRIRSFNMDARIFFIDNLAGARYDVIFADAFNDLSIPYHLTTHEFNQQTKRNLKDGGFFVANVIDDFEEGQFLPSYLQTLRLSFKNVYLLREARPGEIKGRDTFVVVASDTRLDREAFARIAGEKGHVVSAIFEDDELERYLREKAPITLTDDHAPVDNMVAPIFAKRN